MGLGDLLSEKGRSLATAGLDKALESILPLLNRKVQEFMSIDCLKMDKGILKADITPLGLDRTISVGCDKFAIDDDNTLHLEHYTASIPCVENALNKFATISYKADDPKIGLAISLIRKALG